MNLRILLMLLLVISITACSQSPPLKVAAHPWPGYEFMYLADELQILDHDLVTLQHTSSASESLRLLHAGLIDAAGLTLDETLNARTQGLDLVIVLVFNISAGADKVIARDEVQDSRDIRGRRIGVEVGAVGSIMLDRLLDHAGLSVDDVEVIISPVDQHFQQWQDGNIDVSVCYEPFATRILESGGREIFSSQQTPDLIVDVLAIRRDALDREEAVDHLVDAHFTALKHFYTNKTDALYRLSPHLGVKADEVESLYRGLIIPDRDNNTRLLDGNSPELHASIRLLHNVLNIGHALTDDADSEDILTARFIEEDAF